MTAANGVCKAVAELDELVGKIENGEAVETKQIHDQTGETESNEEDEIHQTDDQYGKGENPTESESFAGAVETRESETRVSDLGTKLGASMELNNSSPDIIMSGDDNDESVVYDVELASSDKLELDEGSLTVVADVVECEGANGKCEDRNVELALASSSEFEVHKGSVNVITEDAVECDDAKDICDDCNLDLASSSEFEVDKGSPNVTLNVITEDAECNDLELASSDKLELDEGSLTVVAEVIECEGANGKCEDRNVELALASSSEFEVHKRSVLSESAVECDHAKDKCDDCILDLASSSEFEVDKGSPNVTLNVITQDVECNDLEVASSDKLELDEGSLTVVAEVIECEGANGKCEDRNFDLGSSAKLELDRELLDVVKEAVECDDTKDKCEGHNLELEEKGSLNVIVERDNAKDKCEAVDCGSPKIEVGKEISGETLHLDPKSWPLISRNTKTELISGRTLHSTRWADMVTKVVPHRFKKGKKDNSPKSHAPDPHPKEPVEHPVSTEESPKTARCETSFKSISKAYEPQPQIENSDAKTAEDVSEIDDKIEDASSTTGFYLVKIPRFDDGKLRELIKHAELEVDEKTRLRDAIQRQIQKTRLKNSTHTKVEELQVQYRDADLIRQAAHSELQGLRKEIFDKNKHYRAYICAAAAAKDCASKKDRDRLHDLCANQMENIMQLWNSNDEFRNAYVKYNATSTVRRLGTLDGHSVGPHEAPPILPDVDEKFGKAGPTQTSSSLKLREPKFHKATDQEPDKLVIRNSFATIFGDDVIDETVMNGVTSKKEVECERKAEEKCREEAEAKLNEQLRLEEIAKAKLALERKKRKADKEKRRAKLRAQQEAEQKQKEEEKSKKKEIVAVPSTSEVDERKNICETVQSSEMQTEDVKETKTDTTRRRPKKSKTGYTLPPAIVRNRKKKRSWWRLICLILVCFIGVVLFWPKITGIFTDVRQKLVS